MEKDHFLRDTFGWGLLLWLFGYALSIVFYMVMPLALVGWVIIPLGSALSVWVLFRKIRSFSLRRYFSISLIWTTVAITLDYLLIVQLFKPADGYYKTDVYIYYLLTYILPMIVGWRKQHKLQQRANASSGS